MDDRQLLDAYVTKGSERAFSEVVERYVNFVYSAALRLVRDPQLAEDVTQMVFANLAQKAKSFRPDIVLAGWLHRDTRFTALDVLRAERRRQTREKEAVAMKITDSESATDWQLVRPLLDEALDQLSGKDRDALLLRFFNQRSLREIGVALGIEEDAARKRVARALEKLRSRLARRGVTATSTALSTILVAHAVQAAPSNLAGLIVSSSLAAGGSAVGGISTINIIEAIVMTKAKTALVTAVIAAGIGTPLIIQYQTNRKLHSDNAELSTQLAKTKQENDGLAGSVAQGSQSQRLPDEQFRELLRLRGEVGSLRTQLGKADDALAKASRNTTQFPSDKTRAQNQEDEKLDLTQIAKMQNGRDWMLEFFQHAIARDGQFLSSLELGQQLGTNAAPFQDFWETKFEGNLKELASTATTIVLKERHAWQDKEGNWLRTYAFADGHTEIHRTKDGNFDEWERPRTFDPNAAAKREPSAVAR